MKKRDNKIVMVLLDGLNLPGATQYMCYPAALAANGQARFTTLRAGLPPLSRPAYATILTGLEPLEHGILHNEDSRTLRAPTIFSRISAMGRTVCAAAYGWFFELCNSSPFQLRKHRIYANPDAPISYGIFYIHDSYPDDELFGDAEALRLAWSPAFLLVHSMGIDYAGHKYGGLSPQYGDAIARADTLLASYVPVWLEAGYKIIIISDHGMDANGRHHDNSDLSRVAPMWLAGFSEDTPMPATHTRIACLVLDSLCPASNCHK